MYGALQAAACRSYLVCTWAKPNYIRVGSIRKNLGAPRVGEGSVALKACKNYSGLFATKLIVA